MELSKSVLLCATVLLAYSSTATSLYCYSCSYSKLLSETSIVNKFLEAMSKLSDEHCLLEKDSDRHDAKQQECPPPKSGKMAKCAVFNGTLTADVEILGVKLATVKYHSVVRECIEVDSGDREYANGCHDDLPSTAHNVFDSAFNTLDLGDLQFKGIACYSTDKNKYSHIFSSGASTITGSAVMVASLTWIIAQFR